MSKQLDKGAPKYNGSFFALPPPIRCPSDIGLSSYPGSSPVASQISLTPSRSGFLLDQLKYDNLRNGNKDIIERLESLRSQLVAPVKEMHVQSSKVDSKLDIILEEMMKRREEKVRKKLFVDEAIQTDLISIPYIEPKNVSKIPVIQATSRTDPDFVTANMTQATAEYPSQNDFNDPNYWPTDSQASGVYYNYGNDQEYDYLNNHYIKMDRRPVRREVLRQCLEEESHRHRRPHTHLNDDYDHSTDEDDKSVDQESTLDCSTCASARSCESFRNASETAEESIEDNFAEDIDESELAPSEASYSLQQSESSSQDTFVFTNNETTNCSADLSWIDDADENSSEWF